MQELSNHWQNAIIIQANYREFNQGEYIHYPQVQSCYLAFGITGRGRIKVNNRTFEMIPGKVIFAPWNHSITYIPSPETPFVLGCIHLIPDAGEHGDIQFNAFHVNAGVHPRYHLRKNDFVEKFNNSAERQFSFDSRVINLFKYAIEIFLRQGTEDQLRALAKVIFYEIYEMLSVPQEDDFPPSFQRMLQHVDDYLELPVKIAALQWQSGLSQAGVYRAFRKNLNMTPMQYITKRRLQHAAKVLKTSTVSEGALAASLQFSTTGNFCRAFKKEFGISPGEFRKKPDLKINDLRLIRPCRHDGDGLNPSFAPFFIPESEL